MIWRKVLVLALPCLLLTAATPFVAATASAHRASPHPAIVEVRAIGKTVQGRSIVAWRLGDPRSSRKVVVFAAMHGDEPGPGRILYNLRDGRAIRGADIWVVPQYNPDGVVRRTRQNAHGVDLNRNYPFHWSRQTGATNSGPRAASEPETRVMMAFLRAVHPAYVVSFHQPLKGVGRAGPKGRAFVKRLHRGLRLRVKSFNCSGTCHGTMTEWFNASFPGVAVTVEYGHRMSKRQANRTGPNGLLRAVGASR
jgi:protein MpaA